MPMSKQSFIPDYLLPLIRSGFYTDVYFNRAKKIARKEHPHKRVTMQIFQKREIVVCGIDEVIELLKKAAGYFKDKKEADSLVTSYLQENGLSGQPLQGRPLQMAERLDDLWMSEFDELTIHALSDGDMAHLWEPVMHIEGPYSSFAHLETLYLGILKRRTMVATNTNQLVKASRGKKVFFFSPRFDYFLNQPGDGYAAKIGGASAVSSEAAGLLIDQKAIGTIPHALISLFDGSSIAAAQAFVKHYPHIPLIVLADFDNNCPKTSVELAKALGSKLWGVRLDTAEDTIDQSLINEKIENKKDLSGVNPLLVFKVRQALDRAGFPGVKIVVSGGFNPEKIRYFEDKKCPLDAYGVGSYILTGNFDYTADVVKVSGKILAKAGRRFRVNPRLKKVSP